MSNMRYASPKKSGKGGKGFFVALGVCLIAVGAAAFLTYQNVSQYFSPEQSASSQQPESKAESTQPAGNTVSGVKETASSASSSEAASSAAESEPEQSEPEVSDIPQEDSQENSAAPTAAQTSGMDSVVFPVGGNVLKEFSGEAPVYSVTLDDWRVHEGVDFAAEKGAVVKAFTGGQVKEIYDDPMLGKTIVISHNGGYEAYYCGLGDTTLVSAGDSVYPGQDIGSVKEIPSEVLDASHLHFGVKKDGVWINPMDALAGAEQ